jgi:hypothetical protein
MDDVLLRLLRGTSAAAGTEETRAATAMVTTLVGRDHQARWKTHPLGFFHLAEDVGESAHLRVHVWPRDWVVSDEQVGGDIHDHVFDLRSLVLIGSIANETFEAVEDRNGGFQTLNIEYDPGMSRVSPEGPRVRLEELSYCVHSPGEIYSVRTGVFHRSSAKATPAITLVLASSASAGRSPRVMVAAGHPPPPAFRRRSLSSHELDLLLEAVTCSLGVAE